MNGMPLAAPRFWRYIQENLEMRGKNVGLAFLTYSEYLLLTTKKIIFKQKLI